MKKLKTKHSLQELVPIAIGIYGSLSQKAFKGELSLKEDGLLSIERIAAEPKVNYR